MDSTNDELYLEHPSFNQKTMESPSPTQKLWTKIPIKDVSIKHKTPLLTPLVLASTNVDGVFTSYNMLYLHVCGIISAFPPRWPNI